MKSLLLTALFISATLNAADLPTITVEHLYYLQARSMRVSKYNPEEMIDYCIAQKLGGNTFESLYFQLFTNRIDLARLIKVEQVEMQDPRIAQLNRTYEALGTVLRDEAQKIKNGILSEGQIAADTLKTIGRAEQSEF